MGTPRADKIPERGRGSCGPVSILAYLMADPAPSPFDQLRAKYLGEWPAIVQAREYTTSSYTHLARWWSLAPLGAKACSLGREPQEREVKIESQSPGGATAGHRSEENCRRPSGALG